MKLFFLRVERAFHLVDAYLYSHRGMMALAADSEARAHECERRIDTLLIQELI